AQAFERMRLADLVDLGLDGLGVGVVGQSREPGVEVPQRCSLDVAWRAVAERVGDEVAKISEREIEQAIELRMGLGRGLGSVALHEAPEQILVVGRSDR